MKEIMKKLKKKLGFTTFKVTGAGELKISNSNSFSCGRKRGFSIEVSWSEYGFSGGNLPTEEARKLANLILNGIEDE